MSVSNRCSQTRVAPAMAVRGAVLAVILAVPGPLHALTPGKDGSLTVAAANTVLNRYAVLAANAAAGATSLTVANPGGAYGLDPATLTAGDLVMVYQAQGATIDGTDTPSYGTVTSLNGAGNYELIGVTGVVVGSPSTINLEGGCGGLRNAYTAAGHTQVIRVPQYVALTINAGASVVAPAWDGQTGGVVAIHVRGAATLNGPIDVSGRGFRGGVPANQTNGTPDPGDRVRSGDDQRRRGQGRERRRGPGDLRARRPGQRRRRRQPTQRARRRRLQRRQRPLLVDHRHARRAGCDGRSGHGSDRLDGRPGLHRQRRRADELQWRRARRLRVREQGTAGVPDLTAHPPGDPYWHCSDRSEIGGLGGGRSPTTRRFGSSWEEAVARVTRTTPSGDPGATAGGWSCWSPATSAA